MDGCRRELIGAALTPAGPAAMLALVAALAASTASAQPACEQPVRPQSPPAAKPAPASPKAPGSPKAQRAGKAAPPQASRVWKGRGFAVVSAGAQLGAPGYTSTADFKVHAEDATLTAEAAIGIGPAFGARGGVRVWKNLAVGGGLEVVSTSQELAVTGRLPHPFQFNQYREVEGTASGLDRVETLVAFELSWLVALARRVDMFVFAGPAYISVRQDMATRIEFTETYPYDSAMFTGVETASVSGGGVGATAGIDVSYLVSKRLGIGGEVRYSYASATLKPSARPAAVGLGGLQAAFGARVLF
ncbi:MAG: hypothetical protein R6V57_16785 [Vicinamibacterales bacterium]